MDAGKIDTQDELIIVKSRMMYKAGIRFMKINVRCKNNKAETKSGTFLIFKAASCEYTM